MPPKDAAPTGPDVNLRKDLGIAEIADKATQDQVGGYVEKEIPADKREALNTLKKDEAALTELRKKMSDLNKKTDAQATDYVDAIISALQEEECTTAIEKNYIPAFLEAVGTKGVESLGNKDSGHSIDWGSESRWHQSSAELLYGSSSSRGENRSRKYKTRPAR